MEPARRQASAAMTVCPHCNQPMDRDRLLAQLIDARRQNEHMLATIRKLYEDVRNEQTAATVGLLSCPGE